MIILDSVFTGVKRKADQAEMDISVKRKKIPVSEVKKSSLFTKKLLNQFDSAIKSNEFDEKAQFKSEYINLNFMTQQISTNEFIKNCNSNEEDLKKVISPGKEINLSKITEVSQQTPQSFESSSKKSDKKIFEIEKKFFKGNKNQQILNSDYLFTEFKNKLLEKEINGKNREDELQDDNSESLNSDFNKEEISHEEEDDDLLSLPEKNNINDIMQFKPNYLISEKTRSQSNKEWRNKFACSADSHNENVNEHITSQLENMLDYHENENNHFEANAYRRAIAYLKNSREKITTVDEIKKYKSLGKSISGKIREIILTGKIRKVNFLENNNEKTKVCRLFMKVHGIGISAANKLFKKGYKTIEDLVQHKEELNSIQLLGLKYYEDSLLKIPREECEQIMSLIKKELFVILPENIIDIILCGSYRRGKSSSGDMDILITRKDSGGIDGILSSLLNSLKKINLIKDTFSLGKTSHENYVFMGICQLEKSLPHRRIDIKVYRKENFPFALLYFTGSAYFNRSMRLLARRLGYSLSDKSLYKVDRIKNEKFKKGENIKCENEEEIFKELGLTYKTPQERDI